jgi:hypothetical protein
VAIAPSLALRASVHHDHAEAGGEQQLGVAEDSHTIVGDAVKDQNPIAAGFRRTYLPAAKAHVIGCAHLEVFPICADLRESRVGLPDEVRRKLPAHGVKKPRPDPPAGSGRKERGKK